MTKNLRFYANPIPHYVDTRNDTQNREFIFTQQLIKMSLSLLPVAVNRKKHVPIINHKFLGIF